MLYYFFLYATHVHLYDVTTTQHMTKSVYIDNVIVAGC
jgi:hypothetical protein